MAGELLGEIVDGDPIRQFAGYHGNRKATEKKILRNVFCEGDKYFRTGDLLQQDERGYVHFIDRWGRSSPPSSGTLRRAHGLLGACWGGSIGDTFRWKGENVSTTEVGEVVSAFPGVLEVGAAAAPAPLALPAPLTCRRTGQRVRCERARPRWARVHGGAGPGTGCPEA